jgi:hypothetical protein
MRIRHPFVRSFTMVLMAATLSAIAPVTAAAATPWRERRVPSLAPAVVREALDAPARVVRRDAGILVEEVALTTERATQAGAAMYRVTVDGRFPPRALRYVIRAGSVPIGYGIPGRTGGSVVAVTTDTAVLTEPIAAAYEGSRRRAPDVAVPRSAERAPLPTPGPHDVLVTSYDLGDRAYQPTGLGARVEVRAAVYHPADLTAGPFPIVLFLHGNHSTCYRRDRSAYEWPCRDGWKPIPNHEGYAYLGSRLASYGYIVASVSGNGVNVHGNTVEDTGMRQRGLLLEHHLELWEAWTTTGGDPFGAAFVGTVDMDRIGVMGHSRGGEGAVMQALVDRERPDPFGIDAVLPLAPVDFRRETINEVPLGVILPSCDGDVYDLQGVHFYDDSRYAVPGDTTSKSVMTAFGANHNFFNTVWSPSAGYPGSFDDGYGCSERLGERLQRRVGATYMTAFLREHVGDEDDPRDLWSGGGAPARLDPARIAVSYLAPDDPAWRLDVDRFDVPGGLSAGTTGGAVAATDLGLWGWCANTDYATCIPGDRAWYDIHASFSYGGPTRPGLGEAVIGWDTTTLGTGSVRFELPVSDVSRLDALTFRTVPNPGCYWTEYTELQDLSVVLEDSSGARASVPAADVGNDALTFPLRLTKRGLEGKVIMQQIRFPILAFDGVDPTSIVAVEVVLDRTDLGVITIADLAFQRAGG